MPLHDWNDDNGWDSVHHFWISRLCYWLKPRLPAEYRALVGSMPGIVLSAVNGHPDVGVRRWMPELPGEAPPERPDVQGASERTGHRDRDAHS